MKLNSTRSIWVFSFSFVYAIDSNNRTTHNMIRRHNHSVKTNIWNEFSIQIDQNRCFFLKRNFSSIKLNQSCTMYRERTKANTRKSHDHGTHVWITRKYAQCTHIVNMPECYCYSISIKSIYLLETINLWYDDHTFTILIWKIKISYEMGDTFKFDQIVANRVKRENKNLFSFIESVRQNKVSIQLAYPFDLT